MANKTALILTPHSDFADIVKQTLGKVTSLDVKVACSASEAEKTIRQNRVLNYSLLDLEMGIKEVLRHGILLKERFPEIKLVLISKKEIPPEMDEIRPWAILKKPFVERELFGLFRASNETISNEPEYVDLHLDTDQEGDIVSHLDDKKWVKQTIQSAMAKMDVQEALVFSKEGLIAQSGDLVQETIDECTKILRNAWKDHKGTEIILPVHLDSTDKNHILHSNFLAIGLLLALAYDGDTSLKVIRSQTRYLTRLLKNPQLATDGNLLLPERTGNSEDRRAALEDFAHQVGINKEEEQPRFSKTPVKKSTSDVFFSEHERARNRGEAAPEQIFQADNIRAQGVNQVSYERGVVKSPAQEKPSYSMSLINPNVADVYFACALVPRLKAQSLEYDLAEFLRAEMPNIFLAYGWRLEKLIIEPYYLQWLVGIPPTLAPASHVKVIRKQSSKLILSNFTGLNKNELLQDFWAPGYLVGSGRELLPAEVILEFIRINRWQHYPDEE